LSAIATTSTKLTSLAIGNTWSYEDEDDLDAVAELAGEKPKGPFGIANHKFDVLPLLSSFSIQDFHWFEMIPVARILSFLA
jgi:hypothetical protein